MTLAPYYHRKPPPEPPPRGPAQSPAAPVPGPDPSESERPYPRDVEVHVVPVQVIPLPPTAGAGKDDAAPAASVAPQAPATVEGPSTPRAVPSPPAPAAAPEPRTPATSPGPEGPAPASAPPSPAPPLRVRAAYPAWEWIVLAVVVLIGLALRLREPLSSPIMGAEDSYRHMERTWDLVQAKPIGSYPPGFMLLLAPFTLFGPDAFYTVARYFPPIVGAASVVVVYFLCRPYTTGAGALGASALMATMREQIFRTDILMPTALDMVLVPLLLLAALGATEGKRWAMWTAAGTAVLLAFTHPWALALALVPLLAIALALAVKNARLRKHALWTLGAASVTFAVVAFRFPEWNAAVLLSRHAWPRALELAADPASFWPLPQFVHLPQMIGWPGLVLAAVGLVVVAFRRTRFGVLALVWTALLLPVVLVDWFDMDFVPHRTAVFLSIGVIMLGGLALAEIVQIVLESRPRLGRYAAVGAVVAVLALAAPNAIATQPWYRLYGPEHFEAWDAIDGMGRPYVIAGSWEMRAGYRAITSGEAEFNPPFFKEEEVRAYELQRHPGLVVLIDHRTTDPESGLPTDFLQSWELVGQWGTVQAFRQPA